MPRRFVASGLALLLSVTLAAVRADEAPPGASAPATADATQVESRLPPLHPRAGRARPIVAVVGQNAGTELVDFVVPYGILAESGVADVIALATEEGPLRMRPALRLQAQATIAGFDADHPDGADIVIVPAVTDERTHDAALLAWLRGQSDKGATVVSICDGALVVANAGLFDGHRATGHWATRAQRAREHAAVRWVDNVRYVGDGHVVSSAGVSAAIPASIALVEAIGGTPAAMALAKRLGAGDWSARHDSARFGIDAGTVLTYAGNRWFSSHHDVVLPVADGVDEIALALVADTWARTLRGRVSTRFTGETPPSTVHTLRGLVLLPEEAPRADDASARTIAVPSDAPPLDSLDRSLQAIESAYGASTARFVALQIEYPATF